MSLIKAIDVPEHLAARLRSRRIAARLSGNAAKPTVLRELNEKKPQEFPTAR